MEGYYSANARTPQIWSYRCAIRTLSWASTAQVQSGVPRPGQRNLQESKGDVGQIWYFSDFQNFSFCILCVLPFSRIDVNAINGAYTCISGDAKWRSIGKLQFSTCISGRTKLVSTVAAVSSRTDSHVITRGGSGRPYIHIVAVYSFRSDPICQT